MLFAGALLMQYPIGWLSDRMESTQADFVASLCPGLSCAFGVVFTGPGPPKSSLGLMVAAFFAGGVTTPFNAFFWPYTNDSLPASDMSSASGGLVLPFGLGLSRGHLVHWVGDARGRSVRVFGRAWV